MSSPVEQIKERLPILDVISGYIKVEKSGKNFKARCPFHHEKTPSFFISPDRNSYYCFGCGAKGDVFSFVEAFESVDFMGALTMLAQRAGVILDRSKIGAPDPNARLYAVIEEATHFFEAALAANESAKAYLDSRGVTSATQKHFLLGWSSVEWRTLFDHLLRKGFSADVIIAAGLARQKTDEQGGKSGQPYDIFRSRIMFPIFDATGRPVAFSGRYVGAEDPAPAKYINSPETPIFKKSETLYGFNLAKQSIRQYGFSILVEGHIDLVMAHQAGFTNAIASMGTAITQTHMDRLRRVAGNIVIALDADDAGVASALKCAAVAMRAGMDVKIAALPEGKDPADLVREDKLAQGESASGRELWREVIRTAQHVIDFLLTRIVKKETDTRKMKQRVTREVLPYVALIEPGIDRAHFVSRIASAIGVDEAAVESDIAKLPKEPFALPEEGPVTSVAPLSPRHDRLSRLLHGILFWQEKEAEPTIDAKALRASLERILAMTPESLYNEAERDMVAFEAEAGYHDSARMNEEVKEMLTFLEEHYLKEALTQAMQEINRAEAAGEPAKSLAALARCKEITQRLNSLHIST